MIVTWSRIVVPCGQKIMSFRLNSRYLGKEEFNRRTNKKWILTVKTALFACWGLAISKPWRGGTILSSDSDSACQKPSTKYSLVSGLLAQKILVGLCNLSYLTSARYRAQWCVLNWTNTCLIFHQLYVFSIFHSCAPLHPHYTSIYSTISCSANLNIIHPSSLKKLLITNKIKPPVTRRNTQFNTRTHH